MARKIVDSLQGVIKQVALVNDGEALPDKIGLDAVKAHLDVSFNDDDSLIEGHIAAAVSYIEEQTRAVVRPSQASVVFDGFAKRMGLGLYPVSAITSVSYQDADGEMQAVSVDDVRIVGGVKNPAVAFLNDDKAQFPTTGRGAEMVTVNVDTGWSVLPDAIVHAVFLLVRQFYDEPMGAVPDNAAKAVERLISSYRVY